MHLVYIENRDTKHIIDLQKVLITSFDGKQLTIIRTLVGGITVHIKAKDKNSELDLILNDEKHSVEYETKQRFPFVK